MPFKVFTNGVPLPASDLNDYLMEQSIATFADSAARATALVSPVEGQFSYLADTDALEYYNGSTWTAAGSGGGETLLSTTSLSGASVTISSIPQTYNSLKLVVQSFRPATDATSLNMRYNGVTSTSYGQETSSTATNTGFGVTFNTLVTEADNGASNGIVVAEILNYSDSTNWKLAIVHSLANNQNSPGNYNWRRAGLLSEITNAIDSITLFPGSGNFTSGTALLYGVK